VLYEGEVAAAFKCKIGLRQGDAISLVLYNLAPEKVIISAQENR